MAENKWKVRGKFLAEHLGGFDEPISQNWRGGFTFQIPAFLGVGGARFFEAEIAPGEAFEKSFEFDFKGKISEFGIFRPRGQKLFMDVSISLFPQKTFETANFENHENVGHFFGELKNFRKSFQWKIAPDRSRPFVTLHEVIKPEQLPETVRERWKNYFANSTRRFLAAEIDRKSVV